MGNLNKVLLIGRLGKDPEKRVTSSGSSVTNLTVATSDHWVDQSGAKQEKTEWHRVVLWNRLADIAEQYLKKGSQVYIEGRLQTKEWNDKDGNKRYTTEINGQVLQFLDSKGNPPDQPGTGESKSSGYSSSAHNYYSEPPAAPPTMSTPPTDDFIEDDIPF